MSAVALIPGFVSAVIWRVQSSRHPVDAATIYAADLAAVAIGITLLSGTWAWWKRGPGAVGTPGQVSAAADRLADEMRQRWLQEAAARRIVTPAPATVRWRRSAEDSTDPSCEAASLHAPGVGPQPLPGAGNGGRLPESGVVARLHDEVYAELPYGRLVVTGESGAGKTGAMILLMLAALSHRASQASGTRDRVPVPVWLTLGGWEPGSVSLRKWAVRTMTRDHPSLLAADYGSNAAGDLLTGARVALFLDGLDELPEASRALALKRVDEEARGLRVVITTRPGEYREALRHAGLSNAAVIELRPVRPRAAAAYLRHGQTGPDRERWESVAGYLEQNPGSVAARALDTPLALSLARDSYSAADPSELADPGRFRSVEELRRHLIDQFMVAAYPGEQERLRVIGWLSWLARHMGGTRDLSWWEIPGWVSRWQLHLARGTAVTVIVGSVAAFAAGHLTGLAGATAQGPATVLVTGLVVGASAAAVGEFGAGVRRQPLALAPRLPRIRDVPWIVQAGLGCALLVGLAVAAGLSLAAEAAPGAADRAVRGFVIGLVAGGGFGLVVGLAVGLGVLWLTPVATSPSASALGSYRADTRTCLVAGLLTGLAGGLAAGLSAGLKFSPVFGLEAAVVFGLGAGLTILLLGSMAPLIKLTELLLLLQGRGQVRFISFLEQAVSRQVLRQAGTVYQFRHAELQERLNSTSTRPAR
jgi:hypothetical protein